MSGKNLVTGPINWDEQSIKQAYSRLPQRQLLQYMSYAMPFGLLGLGGRGLLNIAKDPRLEMMFSRNLFGL